MRVAIIPSLFGAHGLQKQKEPISCLAFFCETETPPNRIFLNKIPASVSRCINTTEFFGGQQNLYHSVPNGTGSKMSVLYKQLYM